MKVDERFSWKKGDFTVEKEEVAKEDPDITAAFTITKMEPDKMLVFGWANVAVDADGTQITDLQGDVVDPEELEKAAYDHVLNFRSTGERHDPGMRKKGRLVESCAFTKEKQEAIGIPPGTVPEGWWVGYKIDDPQAWEKIKKGEYQMFSIEGKGQRTPIEKARRNFEDFPGFWEWLEENMDATKEDKEAAESYYGGRTHKRVATLYASVRKFNPYHDARGRFSTANSYASFTTTTRDSKKQHMADLAVQREKKRQAAAAPAKPTVNVDANGFRDYDDADFHQLYNGRGYYAQQNLSQATKQQVSKYLNPNTELGSLYNFSQNMNYAAATGTLAQHPQYKKAFDTIVGSMHNLGHNVTLTRYDHGEFLDNQLAAAGIRGGHRGMSVAQLKNALVGRSYGDNRILSTSYNEFKNASNHQTFTTREVKITYRAKAGTKALMPGDGPGGKFGEMLLAPTSGKTNVYKIVDVKATGNKARSKGQSIYNMNLNQIEVVVEVG